MKYVKTRDSVCINRTCTRCGKSFVLTDQERMCLMEGNIPIPTLCPDCRLAAEKAGENPKYRNLFRKNDGAGGSKKGFFSKLASWIKSLSAAGRS